MQSKIIIIAVLAAVVAAMPLSTVQGGKKVTFNPPDYKKSLSS